MPFDIAALIAPHVRNDGYINHVCIEFEGQHIPLVHDDEVRLASELVAMYHNSCFAARLSVSHNTKHNYKQQSIKQAHASRMSHAMLAVHSSNLSLLLQRWGETPLQKDRVREIRDFVENLGFTQLAEWLSEKAREGESFNIREFALFCLLFNENALLTNNVDNTAVSFDMAQEVACAGALAPMCMAMAHNEQIQMEAFERELDQLVLEENIPHCENTATPTAEHADTLTAAPTVTENAAPAAAPVDELTAVPTIESTTPAQLTEPTPPHTTPTTLTPADTGPLG
jgi:hypothetical protein